MSANRSGAWRWILILAVSLGTHLLLASWAAGYLRFPGERDKAAPEPLAVALLPAPPAQAPEPPPPPPKPAPKPRPKPEKAVKPRPAPVPVVPTEQPAPDAPVVANPASEPAVAEERPEPPVEAEAPAAGSVGDGEEIPWTADVPPPAELEYDVTALRDGGLWYGSGRFSWQHDGERYQVSGEASVTVLFRITVLNFRSEGRLHPEGLAPGRYSETPWRKSIALTWFDRTAGKISFSSSDVSLDLQGGEQDRASVAWQLAALGRGDGSRFTPGGELSIVVAGARNADRWHFRMIGMEEVDTPHGRHLAWHLQRAPRGGRRDQGIDIWLAPGLNWYPVRIRHNYADGEFLDMSLSELHGKTPPQEE